MKKGWEKIGVIAFYIGLALAIIIAIINSVTKTGIVGSWPVIVLGILGIIVGLLNVTDKETVPFLVATIAFMISFGVLTALISTLTLGWQGVKIFFTLLQAFVAPAAAIVAIKTLWEVTREV